jgi:hypothetical protein
MTPSIATGRTRACTRRPALRKSVLTTVSKSELEALRRIEEVVRLGHVRRIEPDRIVLAEGTIPTSPHNLHVHCAARGLNPTPGVPMFAPGRITLQPIRMG